jgi:hypothetical protein
MFFADAYARGPMAVVAPYNGYVHLLPRLTAWFAMGFDPRWMPAVYAGVAFGIWLAVAFALFSPRVILPAKPALALAVALVPHSGEVFICLSNVQWPLALGLVLLLVAEDADTPARRAFDRAAALLCGLTGPFSAFLLPLFVVRAAIRRSRESVWIAGSVALVGGVQAALIYHFRNLFALAAPGNPAWLLSAMGGRLYGTFFAGYRLPQFRPDPTWIAVGIGLTVFGAAAALRPGSWSRAQRMLAGAWVCLALPVAIKFLRASDAISVPANGDRYFFLPHVLLAWLLIILCADFRGLKRILALMPLAGALAANVPCLRAPPMRDFAWAQQVQPIRERKAFSIPINPDGWVVRSAGKDSGRPR